MEEKHSSTNHLSIQTAGAVFYCFDLLLPTKQGKMVTAGKPAKTAVLTGFPVRSVKKAMQKLHC